MVTVNVAVYGTETLTVIIYFNFSCDSGCNSNYKGLVTYDVSDQRANADFLIKGVEGFCNIWLLLTNLIFC